MLGFKRRKDTAKTDETPKLSGAERSAALDEIAAQAASLRARAAELDCGMLAYLMAQAEDEARDQSRRGA